MVRYVFNWRSLLLVLLVVTLGYLYQKTQIVDAARYNEAVAKLRLLKQYDAQWNLDVLRSQLGINRHYDPLVEPLVQFKTLSGEILSIAKDFGVEDSAELRDAEAEFRTAIAAKQDHVERFKSSNAVLHNALAFLPIAAQALHLSSTTHPPHTQDAVLAREGDSLLLRIFEYDLAPDPEAKHEIEVALERLLLRVKDGTERAKPVQVFAAHVRTVMRVMQAGSEQLNRIQSVPIDARIDALAAALSNGYRAAHARVEVYHHYLFLYVGFLIALLAYFAARLVQSYAALNRSNSELIHVNETLEQRVLARTEDLSQANNELTQTLNTLQQTQKQLVESEKMAALGGLVAGVAHEINTPVGVGVTAASCLHENATQLAQLYQQGKMKKADLEDFLSVSEETSRMILNNLERAANLIQSFKQVAVDQSSEAKRRINIKTYLEETLTSLRPKLRNSKLSCIVEGQTDIEIESYPGAISQIVTNLLMNSIAHAYDPGQTGQMTIKVAVEDKQLMLTFSDDGKGIPAAVIGKIFDPFFTTRRGTGGSGLGLNIVYNLVTQTLKGSIECSSVEGEGTSFILRWPIV